MYFSKIFYFVGYKWSMRQFCYFLLTYHSSTTKISRQPYINTPSSLWLTKSHHCLLNNNKKETSSGQYGFHTTFKVRPNVRLSACPFAGSSPVRIVTYCFFVQNVLLAVVKHFGTHNRTIKLNNYKSWVNFTRNQTLMYLNRYHFLPSWTLVRSSDLRMHGMVVFGALVSIWGLF